MNPLFLEKFFRECEIMHITLYNGSPQVLNDEELRQALYNTLEKVSCAPLGLSNEIYIREPAVILDFVREAYSAWVDEFNLTNY